MSAKERFVDGFVILLLLMALPGVLYLFSEILGNGFRHFTQDNLTFWMAKILGSATLLGLLFVYTGPRN